MATEKQRQQARRFLENFNRADPEIFDDLITDDFTFRIVTTMDEFPPLRGRREFVEREVATLRRLFPRELNLTIETLICDGPHVAAIAHCDTIANNGKRYQQQYNFYLRFEGDLIAEGREYNDTDLKSVSRIDQSSVLLGRRSQRQIGESGLQSSDR